ncbi:PaaI family thioesterase [Aquitalea pelogenes]|uniref:PaaI family thioesterase n=1 Tax=Aquitalea pelogenes TaxID=1293573 RepID=UPI0035B34517
MERDQKSLAWASKQLVAQQRIRDGGGAPGLTRMEQIVGKSGRAILDAMMSGELPYPPMNETMNMTLLEVGDGFAAFQGIPLSQHYNPLGTVHGGWFATLLDSALGCAVQATLPAGRSYTTAELSINIVRPASHKNGPLRAVARVIHGGVRWPRLKPVSKMKMANFTRMQQQPAL